MKKEIVKYSNKLNKVPLKGFNKQDLNFFYAICAKVRDKNSDVIELSFEEIAKVTKYANERNSKRLRKDLQGMRKKVLSTQFQYETETIDRMGNLFSTLDISTDKDIITVRVNIDFIDYFNELVKEFTCFELEQYVSLESKYSKNLYRLLKQWKTQGCTPKYTVEEIKELLITPNFETKILMRAILKPCAEELKQKDAFKNLWIETVYKAERGRPVDGYVFHFDKTIEGQLTLDSYMNQPQKKKSKNKFTTTLKQDYDMDELEQQLIANK